MSRTPAAPARAVLIAAAVVLFQVLLVSWFAWPATQIEPRDLPVVVAGPAPASAAVADQVAAVRPGAFAVTTVPTPPRPTSGCAVVRRTPRLSPGRTG